MSVELIGVIALLEAGWIGEDEHHGRQFNKHLVHLVDGTLVMKTLKELKLQSLEKRRISNDLVLTHKIIYNQIYLEASQLFKFSRRPGLRRSSLRLLQQTRRSRRRRNNFACRVVKYWNRLPLAVASVPDQLAFKRQLDTYIYA